MIKANKLNINIAHDKVETITENIKAIKTSSKVFSSLLKSIEKITKLIKHPIKYIAVIINSSCVIVFYKLVK